MATQVNSPTMGLQKLLRHVYVLPFRLTLHTQSRWAEVPRLRGVWGAALHDLDPKAYSKVFHPQGHGQLPGYVLRPIIPSHAERPSFDFILLGEAADYSESALRAWDIAGARGIGPIDSNTGDREPFFVRERYVLGPGGDLAEVDYAWSMDKVGWTHGDPTVDPCWIDFLTPVGLFHKKRLIESPSLTDIIAKGCRRIGSLLPDYVQPQWEEVKAQLIDYSKGLSDLRWQGTTVAVKRYSARQRTDFAIPGVYGSLGPFIPNMLWPILNTLSWVHLGKGTNIGMGWLSLSDGASDKLISTE